MDKNSIAVFVDKQIEENSRDLIDVQIKIQQFEQRMFLCLAMYVKSSILFSLLLSASLNDIFEDSRLDYITFQKARINYNNSIECKELIEDLAICIKTSKKLEKMISKDYAELVMIKEENYNIRIYSTFIFRNLKRYEELLDTDIFDDLLDSLLDDE